MTARKVIIDCDPGQDDAVALFLAMASPDELDILGVTTVAGNVPLELTQRNARMMCDIAGRQDLPVFAGCERPMVLDPITAEYIHGATGIDGVEVFDPETPLRDQHAVDFIIETLRREPAGSVTLVPVGPLTRASPRGRLASSTRTGSAASNPSATAGTRPRSSAESGASWSRCTSYPRRRSYFLILL